MWNTRQAQQRACNSITKVYLRELFASFELEPTHLYDFIFLNLENVLIPFTEIVTHWESNRVPVVHMFYMKLFSKLFKCSQIHI